VRKLVESTFVSLDGDVSERLMSWAPAYWDEEYFAYERTLLFAADALLLGRRTYDGFSVTWPERSGDAYSDRINSLPKHVASTTLTTMTWNATRLEGDAMEAVADLKDQPGGDLLKFGSGAFSRALMEHELIDEIHLWRFPVIAGASDTRFDGMPVTHLELADVTRFASGIVVQVYRPRRTRDAANQPSGSPSP
jgi:dihydrofolate reductase